MSGGKRSRKRHASEQSSRSNLTARRDELFELADARLCVDGPVTSPVDLTMVPEHRRGHGALYGALNRGRIDVEMRFPVCPEREGEFDVGRTIWGDAARMMEVLVLRSRPAEGGFKPPHAALAEDRRGER